MLLHVNDLVLWIGPAKASRSIIRRPHLALSLHLLAKAANSLGWKGWFAKHPFQTMKVTRIALSEKKGQERECKVLSVDQQRRRIALGFKQREEDP